MSHQACSWVAVQYGVSPGEKLLLFAIANRVDECGIGFPGRARLAREACCRPETVTANMKKLVERGMVARFERRRENGSRTSDWVVLAPGFADRAPLEDADGGEYPDVVGDAAKTSGEDSSREVSGGGQVRKTGGPEPSGEQSLLGANAPRKGSGDDDLKGVWAHYQATHPNGSRCSLTPERRLIIRQALKVRSATECKEAITSMLGDEWYVAKGLLDLKYALRGGGRSPDPEATIDRLVGQMRNGGRRQNGSGNGRPRYFDGLPWEQLSSAEKLAAQEMRQMGMDPSDPETWKGDQTPVVPTGRSFTAATFLDVEEESRSLRELEALANGASHG